MSLEFNDLSFENLEFFFKCDNVKICEFVYDVHDIAIIPPMYVKFCNMYM